METFSILNFQRAGAKEKGRQTPLALIFPVPPHRIPGLTQHQTHSLSPSKTDTAPDTTGSPWSSAASYRSAVHAERSCDRLILSLWPSWFPAWSSQSPGHIPWSGPRNKFPVWIPCLCSESRRYIPEDGIQTPEHPPLTPWYCFSPPFQSHTGSRYRTTGRSFPNLSRYTLALR